MPIRAILIAFCVMTWFASTCFAQNSFSDFQKILSEKAAFEANDFAALKRGETVVKLLPPQNKREVAVSGLVRLQVPAQVFLESFMETMVRKSNPAILEIGRFSSSPSLADLQALTLDPTDIEDLKSCVVGECRLKLSSAMIERFHKEVNWEAPDYQTQAAHLMKVMLVSYVGDYLTRGNAALIEYNDGRKQVSLAEEQQSLLAAPSYLTDGLKSFLTKAKEFPKPEVSIVENAIIWSKIKFGLKPVIALNHVTIYKREAANGLQVLVASEQIYANHYFDSSLALTGFVNIEGGNSYLYYENRSRADGLEGVFGNLKRGIVEYRAVAGLKTVLQQSQLRLAARGSNIETSEARVESDRNWRNWTIGRVHVFLWLICITAFAALLRLGMYDWRSSMGG